MIASMDQFDPALREAVSRLIREDLNERERLVVVLRYYERLGVADIAQALGASEDEVGQVLTDVLRRARNMARTAGAADFPGGSDG